MFDRASTMSFLLAPDGNIRQTPMGTHTCTTMALFLHLGCPQQGLTATKQRRASTALAREQLTCDTTNSISLGSMPSSSTSPSCSLAQCARQQLKKGSTYMEQIKIKLTQNAKQIVRKPRASPSAKDTPRPLQPLASPVPAAC